MEKCELKYSRKHPTFKIPIHAFLFYKNVAKIVWNNLFKWYYKVGWQIYWIWKNKYDMLNKNFINEKYKLTGNIKKVKICIIILHLNDNI